MFIERICKELTPATSVKAKLCPRCHCMLKWGSEFISVVNQRGKACNRCELCSIHDWGRGPQVYLLAF
jgi:hypothetical protein